MAKLKTIYATQEDIPEGFADLYAERGGQYELTGIEGVKTEADVDRVRTALRNEKDLHKQTKEQLTKFSKLGELDPEEVLSKLEELDTVRTQLDAVTKDGKIDETKIEPIIEARVKKALGPVERKLLITERDLADAKKVAAEKEQEVLGLTTKITMGSVERAIRDAASSSKVISTAVEDAVMSGLNVFEIADDGEIVTKDNISGVTPGIKPADWLKDMQEKRPHWWPASQGSGSRGANGQRLNGADNPWSPEGWNLTKQGQVIKTQGADKAKQMAEAVGSRVGATAPASKKQIKAARNNAA